MGTETRSEQAHQSSPKKSAQTASKRTEIGESRQERDCESS